MCCSLLLYAHLIIHSSWNTFFFYHSTQVRFEVIYANYEIVASLKTLKTKRNKMYSVIQVLNSERQATFTTENDIVSVRTKYF